MKKASNNNDSLIDNLVRRDEICDPFAVSKRELAMRDLVAALEGDQDSLSKSKLLLLVCRVEFNELLFVY